MKEKRASDSLFCPLNAHNLLHLINFASLCFLRLLVTYTRTNLFLNICLRLILPAEKICEDEGAENVLKARNIRTHTRTANTSELASDNLYATHFCYFPDSGGHEYENSMSVHQKRGFRSAPIFLPASKYIVMTMTIFPSLLPLHEQQSSFQFSKPPRRPHFVQVFLFAICMNRDRCMYEETRLYFQAT